PTTGASCRRVRTCSSASAPWGRTSPSSRSLPSSATSSWPTPSSRGSHTTRRPARRSIPPRARRHTRGTPRLRPSSSRRASARRAWIRRTRMRSGRASSLRWRPATPSPTRVRRQGVSSAVPTKGAGSNPRPLLFRGGEAMRGLRAVAVAAVCLSASIALASGPGQPFDDDDAGCVPDTTEHRKCSEKLAKAFGRLIAAVTSCHDRQARAAGKSLAKLAQAARRCHAKMAYTFLAGRTFDEEACEEFDPLTGRGARDRYSMRALRLIAHGGCPSCLDDIQQEALAVRTIGQLDADNARLYPCP